jgi:hypothetical protein
MSGDRSVLGPFETASEARLALRPADGFLLGPRARRVRQPQATTPPQELIHRQRRLVPELTSLRYRDLTVYLWAVRVGHL